MNEQDVWEFQWKGFFVRLWVKEYKKQLPLLDLKKKNWQIVLESLSKPTKVLFWASGCIFDLLLPFIIFRKRRLVLADPSASSQSRGRCGTRRFWLTFGPDRLTSGSTSVPQYYHPMLSAPVVSHGTAVSNPALAKSASGPVEAARSSEEERKTGNQNITIIMKIHFPLFLTSLPPRRGHWPIEKKDHAHLYGI